MTFTRKDHSALVPADDRTDAHNQLQADGSDAAGKPYLENASFARLMSEMGWEAPWTDEDAAYSRSHSGRGGRSLIAIIQKRLTDNGLIGQAPPPTGEPVTPPGTTPPFTPQPATPAPRPPQVHVGERVDALEVRVAALEAAAGAGSVPPFGVGGNG